MAHMIELGPVPPNIRQYNLFQTIYSHSLAKKLKNPQIWEILKKRRFMTLIILYVKYCHLALFLAQSFPYISGIICKLDMNII